jgi:hypothetical protein
VDSSGADFHHDQDIESAQGDGVEGEEVGGQQSGGLGVQEGPPAGVCSAWCGAEVGGGEDSADGARAQAVSQPDQFALDTSGPQDGFSCARRTTMSRILSLIGGRPGGLG